ncbi:uncharacterized protein LOC114530796 [Dendronephthya gigantea]|uniref:uncharacterized protein LOC114530796 n=1 Tax=Dendronephthya gigantea TaxID=151771 RepID=UPI00106BDC0A|nr:uncharacterized protein LOC114530796 [Dendronephthya gigantea]
MVERFNRTLAAQLSLFVNENQTDWDEHLSTVLVAYRTAVHKSTGQTPAKMMMGHELRLPIDLIYGKPPGEEVSVNTKYGKMLDDSLERAHEFARNQLIVSGERMKNNYDIDSSKTQFEKGDNVWLYTPQRKKGLSPKLQRKWKGPYSVVKRINDLVYKIQAGPRSKPVTVHRNRLWKYSGRDPQTWIMNQKEEPVIPKDNESKKQKTPEDGRKQLKNPIVKQRKTPNRLNSENVGEQSTSIVCVEEDISPVISTAAEEEMASAERESAAQILTRSETELPQRSSRKRKTPDRYNLKYAPGPRHF